MNPSDYIISKINIATKAFPNTKARYEFVEAISSHFVEITPGSVYDSEPFKIWEEEVFFDFIDQYPNDTLSFFAPGGLNAVQDVYYESLPLVPSVSPRGLVIQAKWNPIEIDECTDSNQRLISFPNTVTDNATSHISFQIQFNEYSKSLIPAA